jgi:hypothetical protein
LDFLVQISCSGLQIPDKISCGRFYFTAKGLVPLLVQATRLWVMVFCAGLLLKHMTYVPILLPVLFCLICAGPI